MRGFVVVCLFFLLAAMPVDAIYDPLSVPNNRFGIHILEPAEVGKAAELVNSSGGDWGYVTIPIRANDRDLDKWTTFMNESRKLHLIPILRIASFPVDDHWMAPNEWDIIDFVNFMDELPWPVKNRYIIVYNEPNHKNEWGGFVYPEEYARVLSRAADIFHKRNSDYFIIAGGMDSSAPNGENSLDEYEYLRRMNQAVPGIFRAVDGFSSHAYGNPAFASFPNIYSPISVANYRFEKQYLATVGIELPKIFLTEAGWDNKKIGDEAARNFYRLAFQNIWIDENIVAVTPFVLDGGTGPFSGFSFVNLDGSFKGFAKEIITLPKTSGKPIPAEKAANTSEKISNNFKSAEQNNGFMALVRRILSLFRL